MKRTQELLAAFVPPVVTGVAVGVLGVSGCNHSTDKTPTSGSDVAAVREKEAGNNRGKEANYSEEDIESAAEHIKGVLPTDRDDHSSWLTKEDLYKKLPTIKSALIDEALDSLKKERQILVFDDSGTFRYAKPKSHRP